MPPTPNSPAPATVPVATLAKLLNLTPARCQQLAKNGTIPRAQRGKYPLFECITAYIRFLQKETLGTHHSAATGTAPVDPTTPRARREAAAAGLAELELARANGEYAPTATLLALWHEIAVTIRATLSQRSIALVTLLADATHTSHEITQIIAQHDQETLAAIAAADASQLVDCALRPHPRLIPPAPSTDD